MRFELIFIVIMLLRQATAFRMIPTGVRIVRNMRSASYENQYDSVESDRPTVITSSTNGKVQLFKSLQHKRKRDSLGLIVLEGGRMVQDALKQEYLPHLILMTNDAYHESNIGRDIRHTAESLVSDTEFAEKQARFVPYEPRKGTAKTILTDVKPDVQEESAVYPGDGLVHLVSDAVFKSISETTNGQGIIATFAKKRVDKEAVKRDILTRGSALIVILDGIQDPGNMGSLIRSSYGLGVNLLLSVNSCDAFNSKVIRSSMGTVLSLPIVEFGWNEAGECLKEVHSMINSSGGDGKGYQMVVADGSSGSGNEDSVAYDKVSYVGRDTVLVIGSEAHGVSREARSMLKSVHRELSGGGSAGEMVKVCIPMTKGLESFNAAVAGSILLAEINKQMRQ